MNRIELYTERIAKFHDIADKFRKSENRLSMGRLSTFVTGLILFFALITVSPLLSVILFLICMTGFAWLVRHHAWVEEQKNYNLHLETINTRELECLKGNYSGFADGKEYMNRDHPNSFDLDLFGHASIFQFINRTTSKPASDKLSAWLNSPAGKEEIISRQQAAEDLSHRLEWRQQLMTFGYSNPNSSKDPKELLDWIYSKDLFQKAARTKRQVNFLNVLTIAAIAAVIFGLPARFLFPLLLLNFIYYFLNGKRITTLHDRVGKSSEMLKTYASTIRLIEQEKFNSDALTKLKGRFSTDNSASQKIARLSKITDRLDARLNILVAIPQNLFFFWDIRCCLALEKWKNDNSQ